MATYKGTVNANDVSGSNHTDFPVYVDLSDIGITTQAQADSVRVYSDSSLTTELPREIVSDSEMWFKSSSLNGGDEYWVDYDGVRSDYATNATYGAENVWSDYKFVSHDGGATDSTGNSTPSAEGNATTTGATSAVGDSASTFDDTGDYYSVAHDASFNPSSTGTITLSIWAKHASGGSLDTYISKGEATSGSDEADYWFLKDDNDKLRFQYYGNAGDPIYESTSSLSTLTSYHYYAATHTYGQTNGATLYVDGSSVAGSFTRSNGSVTAEGTNTVSFKIGAFQGSGGTIVREMNGELDESRMRFSLLSSDWISTEYNNQNDPTSFWTWNEVVSRRVFNIS